MDAGLPGAPDAEFGSDYEGEILRLLREEPDAQIAFQGLRRRLGLHQESLARALRRLREDELVEKTEVGYRLTAEGFERVRGRPVVMDAAPIPVLRTVLPGRHLARQAAAALQQRWFGALRWYGLAEDSDGVTLSWTTGEGDVRLDARFEGILLAVDGWLAHPSLLPEAILAAHRLLYEVTQAYLQAGRPALPAADS